jgi:hypothetical protein
MILGRWRVRWGADGEYSISGWIVMLISLYHQVDVLRNSHLLIA